MPKLASTEPGDVLVWDEVGGGIRKAEEDSSLVVGCHSDTYGFCLGDRNETKGSPVGLSGRGLKQLMFLSVNY